jgi:hypothetical protein
MKAKKVHLSSQRRGGNDSRSRCRYTSRPSRNLIVLPLEEFIALPNERKCQECVKAELETL